MSSTKQTPEANAFLERVDQLPSGSVSLDGVLQPSLEDEAELRKLFAKDKDNTRLKDPYVGLVDVFAAPSSIRTTRQRVYSNEEERHAKYVMVLNDSDRRKEGEPAMVDTLDDFLNNFKIFTEGALAALDWSNVIVAGGAVLACLLPVPDEYKTSKRSLRKWFHTTAYPASDVDLFIWGLNVEQAEKKLQSIFEAVRDSVPWDVTCIRTKHAISIHSQYPYRSVQIVLRLYSSPAEVLTGFDVDTSCCAYDGSRVWANPRAIIAMIRQCNTVDVTRRSPSYEVRLAKYAARHFEIYVPNLRRNDIDPTIYERSIVRIEGLARLLVLEKLADPESRNSYLDQRRQLRGRPELVRPWQSKGRKYKGDLKADTTLDGLQMNDYDVVSLHIPYGPGWDARRIDKLVYSTDLGMNSPFNPKNKNRFLHRHPAFFGTMHECMADCCGACPDPENEEEEELQKKEESTYIRGRVEFIQQDPGRQSLSGSFNPIDEGEWTEMAYIGPTELFFSAIVAGNREAVKKMLREGVDPNRRDHVGRAPLHVAILSRQLDIVSDLIDADARMTARLVDGRTSLHLAAQLGEIEAMRKLLDRSAINAKKAEEASPPDEEDDDGEDSDAMDTDEDSIPESGEETDIDRPSSEDDWSSDSSDGKSVKVSRKKTAEASPPEDDTAGGLPEDHDDEPDVLDLNLPDWDLAFTPLGHAVVAGSLDAVGLLLAQGASPSVHTKAKDYGAEDLHPLTLTTLTEDKEDASRIAVRLVMAGAKSSTAKNDWHSIFHRILRAPGTIDILMTLLECDPSTKKALQYPTFPRRDALFPIISAVDVGDWAKLTVLLAHGLQVNVTQEEVDKAFQARKRSSKNFYGSSDPYPGNTYLAMETALARGDAMIHLLAALGAEINAPTQDAIKSSWNENRFLTVYDWLATAKKIHEKQADSKKTNSTYSSNYKSTEDGTWKAYRDKTISSLFAVDAHHEAASTNSDKEERLKRDRQRTFLEEAHALYSSLRPKTWTELYPDRKPGDNPGEDLWPYSLKQSEEKDVPEFVHGRGWSAESVPEYLASKYEELFEACWSGDNERVHQLCLPHEDSSHHAVEIASQWRLDKASRFSYTALHAAILSRHWDTAKLVLSIAASQYVSEEQKKKFTTSGMDLDNDADDTDSDEHMSSGSDGTVDEFTELGAKSAKVTSEISPDHLLDESIEHLDENGERLCRVPLEKAVRENDMEAFVQISNLYAECSPPVNLPVTTLNWILDADNSELLDEYLRRTAAGVPVPPKRHDKERQASKEDLDEESSQTGPRARKRTYDGLDVHGKKRKDLAHRGDPNAKSDSDEALEKPLLWLAAGSGSIKIFEYLCSPRLSEAYKAYAAIKDDERARMIRDAGDLSSVLPRWLGWEVNGVNETALVAALQYAHTERNVVSHLFTTQPRLMSDAVNLPIKFTGTTPLMVAISSGASLNIIEELLKRGASVTDTDRRGANILHIAVESVELKKLQYLLKTLPWDVTRHLLVQRTRQEWQTPLHIAVGTRWPLLVKTLLQEVPEPLALEIRNIDGNMPLHIAVSEAQAETTGYLLDSMIFADISVHSENAMGDTAMEIALQRYLLEKTRSAQDMGAAQEPAMLSAYSTDIDDPVQFSERRLESRLGELKTVLGTLSQKESFTSNSALVDALRSFVTLMEEKLAIAKAQPKASPETTDQRGEEALDIEREELDQTAVLKLMRAAVAKQPGSRKLVHLSDVQASVKSRLAKEQEQREQRLAREAKAKKADEEGEGEERDKVDEVVLQSVLGLVDREAVEAHFKPKVGNV